eukprot:13757858-Alexandrium_andersonii.AAC.1
MLALDKARRASCYKSMRYTTIAAQKNSQHKVRRNGRHHPTSCTRCSLIASYTRAIHVKNFFLVTVTN